MDLSLVLAIVLIVLAVLIVLVAAFLFVPLDVTFRASGFSSHPITAYVVIRWIGLPLWKKKLPGDGKKETKPKESKPKTGGLDRFAQILRAFGNARSSFEMLLRHTLRAISFKKLDVDVVFGLGDPADTAVAMGYFWSLNYFLDFLPKASLKVRPDLQQERFDGLINAQASVQLFPILSGFVRAFLNKRFRVFVKEIRRRS
jgi:hypothetical protein